MAEEVFGSVYVVTNKVNGKQYVGITTKTPEKRWSQHCCDAMRLGDNSVYFHQAIRKYGADAFDLSSVDTATNLEELREKERSYILMLGSKKPGGYNLTDGGEGCYGKVYDEDYREMRRQVMLSSLEDDDFRAAFMERISKPVIANWVKYENQTAAARALGVADSTIYYRIQNKVPGYSLATDKDSIQKSSTKPVLINGVEYASATEADLALGLRVGTVNQRLHRGQQGYEYADGTNYYAEREQRELNNNRISRVMVHGVEYRSANSAGRALGVTYRTIINRINKGVPGYVMIRPCNAKVSKPKKEAA